MSTTRPDAPAETSNAAADATADAANTASGSTPAPDATTTTTTTEATPTSQPPADGVSGDASTVAADAAAKPAPKPKPAPRPAQRSTPAAAAPKNDNPLLGRVARRAAQVRPAQAASFEVKENQLIQISDQLGKQVAVMIGFNLHDFSETLSPAQTRLANNALFPRLGDGLYSSRHRRMLTLIGDTVGRHDTLLPLDTVERYLEDYGLAEHLNSRDTMQKALTDRKHIIEIEQFPDPINWFAHVGFFGRAELDIREPISERGDHILLRAHMDVLLVIAASPNDQNALNGFSPSDLLVRVYQ